MTDYLHLKEMEIPLYKGSFLVVLSNSLNLVKDKFPKFSEDEEEEKPLYAHSLLTPYDEFEAFALILNFDSALSKITHGVIAHEAFHIASFIGNNRGFSSYGSEEPLAYLIEWITNEVYSYMKEKEHKIDASS